MKNLRIHCFQHVSFEGLGCIESWIEQNNHSITYTKFYENIQLPDINNIDWLIVMGGPMGVYDDNQFAWLKEEKQLIKQAIDANKTVIGICLGAQLIAQVLGAKVYRNMEKEIGWFDVSLTAEGKESKLLQGFDNDFTVFHWHGDTFDLPKGAVHLIQTAACKNQAYVYKEKVLGLQFHFEVTENTLGKMIENGKEELVDGNYIQTEIKMLSNSNYILSNNVKLFTILDRLVEP